MKFKSITARNMKTGWNIENMQFNPMLTLMVGASGVGKTKVLNVIKILARIARGESFNGLEWRVEFEQNEHSYVWEGKFEMKDEVEQDVLRKDYEEIRFAFEKEMISDNGEVIVERSPQSIVYKSQGLVKLDNTKSVVELLKEESLIEPIFDGYRQCYSLNTTENRIRVSPIISSGEIPMTIKQIKRKSSFSPLVSLYLLHKNKLKEFDVICQRFQDIFPSVEKIGFSMAKSVVGRYFLILKIKERKISTWIEQPEISSGMMRTLQQIITLVLANEGDVIMIDEFENGLGVNCINKLADLIMEPEADIQVVMTSHHPYIINTIPVKDWKILTRNGSNVKAHTAEELHIGEHSKHEAFMQLMQTTEFQTGQNH